ncbi:MAG: cell wall hydrolase [Blautia sp.]|nr:cell wall hydrolase [Blautia sp.]
MSRRKEEEAKAFFAVMMAAAFCMFAGAAGYHQYLKTQEAKDPLATSQVSQDQIIPIEEATVYNITTENAYFVAEPVPVSTEAGMSDLDLIAACVEAEAGNQDLTGKRLVVDVILNRVDAEGFPDTVEGVISQPRHFTSYWNGAMDRAEPSEETYKAVRMEMEERSYPGLLYFDSEGYLPYGTPWKKVGDHYFSTR